MGNIMSVPMPTASAQAQLRQLQPEMIPITQSDKVKATEEAKEPGPRELAISAQLFHVNPKMVEFSMIESVVRRGYVDKIRILFDAETYTEFIPKLTRMLSYSDKVHYLELFSDQLPLKPLLPFYSYPNVLDSLPPRLTSLTNLHIATTPGHFHFDILAKVMIRSRHLYALKLEGLNVSFTQSWIDYIPCNLHTLILRYVDISFTALREILSRSGQSLRNLHIEHVSSCDREMLAHCIGLCVPGLASLTVIVPDTAALQSNTVELASVLDSAMAAPLLSVRYLYCAGLCISDFSFLREKNAHGSLATVVPSLQKLVLHSCRRVRPGGLTLALAQNRLPKLTYLEALWPISDSRIEDLAMLYHVCSERNIMLSPAMTEYYRELNANLVLEEGMQDTRKWTDKAIQEDRQSGAAGTSVPHDPLGASTQEELLSPRSHTSRHKHSKKHSSRHKHRRTDDNTDEDDLDDGSYNSTLRSDTKSHKSHRSRRSTRSRHHS